MGPAAGSMACLWHRVYLTDSLLQSPSECSLQFKRTLSECRLHCRGTLSGCCLHDWVMLIYNCGMAMYQICANQAPDVKEHNWIANLSFMMTNT